MLFAPPVAGQATPSPLSQLIPLIIVAFVIISVLRKAKIKNTPNNNPIIKQATTPQAKKKAEYNDEQYDKIINCPPCEGNGRTYINTYVEKFRDGKWKTTKSLSSKQLFDIYAKFSWQDEYKSSYDNDDCEKREDFSDCPYCNGSGTAYAWFEEKPASYLSCKKCNGSGHILEKVKLDIGMGEKHIICDLCSGTGKIQKPKTEVAHVKTVSGGTDECEREVNKMGGEIGRFPKRFMVEISDDNKLLYSKSKQRVTS